MLELRCSARGIAFGPIVVPHIVEAMLTIDFKFLKEEFCNVGFLKKR